MPGKPEIAVVLNAHENSPVFRDTLESVRHHWTDRVMVVVDAKNWRRFGDDTPAMKLEGFYHGKGSAPYRNMCLGLMKAWETWKGGADWFCYMEYDCLVGSENTKLHLAEAAEKGIWLLGNDYRRDSRRIPFIERFEGEGIDLHYLLGCCLFFNGDFMSALDGRNFFERFLEFTNFETRDPFYLSPDGGTELVYDISEFLYPTLAVRYGGIVAELACWEGGFWRGGGDSYPMRFRPDLEESQYTEACVMHPVKSYENLARAYHRTKRGLMAKADRGLYPRSAPSTCARLPRL